MDIYIVTRRSENKSDVPNLGIHFTFESAKEHFDRVVEDRKGRGRQYKCNVRWVNNLVLEQDDVQGTIREAYIEHPKTSYHDEYVEILQIEWYHKDIREAFVENL